MFRSLTLPVVILLPWDFSVTLFDREPSFASDSRAHARLSFGEQHDGDKPNDRRQIPKGRISDTIELTAGVAQHFHLQGVTICDGKLPGNLEIHHIQIQMNV